MGGLARKIPCTSKFVSPQAEQPRPRPHKPSDPEHHRGLRPISTKEPGRPAPRERDAPTPCPTQTRRDRRVESSVLETLRSKCESCRRDQFQPIQMQAEQPRPGFHMPDDPEHHRSLRLTFNASRSKRREQCFGNTEKQARVLPARPISAKP